MMKIKEFLLTGFYTGYSPVGPGTAGTFAAMVIYIGFCNLFGDIYVYINAVLAVAILYPSVKICNDAERIFGKEDPGQVVIDEMSGYWIAVMLHPFSWTTAILAFFIFRVLDIVKPFPANRADNMGGGIGIMLDDWIAGIYTNIILIIIHLFLYPLM